MLPRIAPYPLPRRDELPANRVEWRADPARAVLLIHDMQNYFLAAFGDGDSPLPGVLDNIAAVRKHCAELGVPVVFTGQPGGQSPHQRGLLLDFWGDGPPADPDAVAITRALTPAPGETRLTKHRYSAFVGTDLADVLGERDQLIVTGVYAHIGVLATALDAFMNNVQPFVLADAVADFTAEDHAQALRHVARRCGRVATTAELAGELLWGGELTIETLRAQVLDTLGERIGDHDSLVEAGLDSVRLMTLLQRWQAAGKNVSFLELAERPTIAGWAELMARGT